MEVTCNSLSAVVGLPDMIQDFCQLYKNITPTVYYDTTFSMGNFYMMTLLYWHTVLHSKPVMLLLMLINERRTTASHELLFSWFKKLTSVTAVTRAADREQSISMPVRSVLHDVAIAYCCLRTGLGQFYSLLFV